MLKLLDLLVSILVVILFFEPVRLLSVVILCNLIKLLYGVAHIISTYSQLAFSSLAGHAIKPIS